MMRRVTVFRVCITVMVFLASCIDPYRPGEVVGNVNYLVVDGFLNATENTCLVKLSRTIPLTGTEQVFEKNATVSLEDDHAQRYNLTELANGEYKASGIPIDNTRTYQLKIVTLDGEEYQSEFVPILYAPPIDSISWNETKDGVGVYATTHNPANNTRYYYWKFTETWQYRAQYRSILKIAGDTVDLRDYEELKIYECWNTAGSNEILVGSSDKLNEDIISQFNLTTIPFTSAKLHLKYSVLVEQRAIDSRAYDYWQLLKKNTEEMGTIFDPLPSAAVGNMRCVTSPGKIVLGYFNASTASQQRIFIEGGDVEFPLRNVFVTGYEECSERILLFGDGFGNLVPIVFEMQGMQPIGYRATTPYCIDCRLQGGTTVKPDFWEDLN